MTAPSVCAVVVTYQPDNEIVNNLSRIAAQVQGLVVVDNGSEAAVIMALRGASRGLGLELIENRENLGIAQALNQGVRWAKSRGYPWVVLFDQDSIITDGFICRMFAAWQSHPYRERVASIHPRYVDPKTRAEPLVRRAGDGGPMVSLTSGELLPTWTFDKIGWLASDYFIDCVDYEYCLRIRAAGYLIIDSMEAVLLHSAGNPDRTLSFLGLAFRPTHHSAVRRYYMSRNRIVLFRTYFHVFPGWVLQAMYDSMRDTIKCFIGERDRARKLRSLLLGTWDGLIGRMGKRKGL